MVTAGIVDIWRLARCYGDVGVDRRISKESEVERSGRWLADRVSARLKVT
jgi:hypothetical protein